ncbi:short-chain dehydrogenase [Apiospora phragmitis]|uniref:Short-chain dehydrogenase n=1 Tax=Apiospora phragmitis TaxID=2905665 RepID=A0ABR1SSE6_9PEZI
MSNKKTTILMTGANGGLGSAIASHPASVPPASHEQISLDLARLSSVRELAVAINARVQAGTIPSISVIILNAGFEEYDTQTWNDDCLDMTSVVNYLGHWLLTLLLLQSMDRENECIVWISSSSQNPEDPHNAMTGAWKEDRCKTIMTDDFEPLAKGTWSSTADEDEKTAWMAAYRRYGASKMCGVAMILSSHELQRRLDKGPLLNHLSVLAVDPGGMDTGIGRYSPWIVLLVFRVLAGWLGRLLVHLYPNGTWRTPQKSARDVLAAALDCGPPPLTERPKGIYLNGSELRYYNTESKEPRAGRVIWEGSLRYTQLREAETVLQDWQ